LIADVPDGFSFENSVNDVLETGVQFQTCFGSVQIYASTILRVLQGYQPGSQLARFDNWLLATLMISLEVSMGGVM